MDNEMFLKQELFQQLSKLDTQASAAWGIMSAQEMVEHLADFFDVSSGKISFPLAVPEEALPKYKAFLYSDKEFRPNTKAPETVLGEKPLPLRHASLAEAINQLRKSVADFYSSFSDDKNAAVLHPAFGDLNFEEWQMLHAKHVRHHLRQFGLWPMA